VLTVESLLLLPMYDANATPRRGAVRKIRKSGGDEPFSDAEGYGDDCVIFESGSTNAQKYIDMGDMAQRKDSQRCMKAHGGDVTVLDNPEAAVLFTLLFSSSERPCTVQHQP